MGKKNQARKGRAGTTQGGAVDSLSADLSDLFKTLPPIKRADLTKTVEKLFQVVCDDSQLSLKDCPHTKSQVSSNFSSEPLTPAKQWAEFQEIQTLVEKVLKTFRHKPSSVV